MSNGSSGPDDTPPTEVAVAIEFIRVVKPVIDAVDGGPQAVGRLLDDMGVSDRVIDRDAEKVFTTVENDVVGNGEDIVKSITTIVQSVGSATNIDSLSALGEVNWKDVSKEVDLKEFKSVVQSAIGIYEAVEALSTIDVDDPNVDNLADAVLDYLVIRYLKTYRADVHAMFCVTGVIVKKGPDTPSEFKPGEIGDAITDPIGTGTEVLNWAVEEERLQAVMLLTYVRNAMLSHDIPASTLPITDTVAERLAGTSDLDTLDTDSMDGWGQQLIIPIVSYSSGAGDDAEIGVKFVPVPPKQSDSQGLPGLAALTYGTFSGGESQSLDGGWTVGVESSGELANRGVVVQPRSGQPPTVEFRNVQSGSSGSQDTFVVTTTLSHSESTSVERDIVNIAVGHVRLQSIGFEVTTEYTGGEFEVRVAATATGQLRVQARGGFLEKVIPEPIEYDFDVTVGWSSKSGFFVQNGGTLETSIPTNVDLGFLKVAETHLGISPKLGGGDGDGEAPGVPVTIGTSPSLTLSFLQADVQRVGLELALRLPEDGGNLGMADLQVGFNPPNGIGLTIDAGTVSGGGQLNFYPDENRYSGALSLQIGTIGLNAIGLLKTELPGGKDGYSLLVLITADIQPIQLGFGFVLTGVGGLLGIHRQAKMDELGATVRTGSLSSVLFPENVVQNSQQIISDLRSIFPPRADRHVVGPMAELGWGQPVVLQMKIGVILEIPTWQIGIAGIFDLDLPDEEAPLIDLNLAVVGVIDIPNKRIAIDASLYDSRVVSWTVSGDMAMRLKWGKGSRFLLSIGGFNPRYDPPPKFPALDRVKVEMSPPGGNPRMGMKGYLAVTPNTFQVGAKYFFHGEFGPATIDGKLGFDALFQFDPFKFVIDFIAKVSVGIKGHGLTLKLTGTLKGPGPFHLNGKVHIEILFFEITAKVDVTFGESQKKEPLPAANVMRELTNELGKTGNWSGQLPPEGASVVTVRRPKPDQQDGGAGGAGDGGGTVLIHPLGGISIRQTVVPLASDIEKYGNATPATYERFAITDVSVDGNSLSRGRRVKEKFAPAKYRKMSDSEKLNSPAFEKREAGVEAGSNLLYYPERGGASSPGEFADRTITTLEYETSVIDTERAQFVTPLVTLGSYAALRPEAGYIGIPQQKVGELIEATAAGEAFRRRHEYQDVQQPLYGARGGVVIGERDGPGDRIVDSRPGEDTTVLRATEVESVVDDGTVGLVDDWTGGDLVLFGDRDGGVGPGVSTGRTILGGDGARIEAGPADEGTGERGETALSGGSGVTNFTAEHQQA